VSIRVTSFGRPVRAQFRKTGWLWNDRLWQILLQKSAGTDRAVGPFVRGRGFDVLDLTLLTQLQRYAMHRAPAGGGRATSDVSRRRF
jgi:hypothetical protein